MLFWRIGPWDPSFDWIVLSYVCWLMMVKSADSDWDLAVFYVSWGSRFYILLDELSFLMTFSSGRVWICGYWRWKEWNAVGFRSGSVDFVNSLIDFFM